MSIFSTNKKILITSVSLFMGSLLMILFVLDSSGAGNTYGKNDVLNSGGHGSSHEQTSDHSNNSPESPYDIYLNGNSGPWFVTGPDGVFVYLNEEFCDLLKIECKDLEKKNFFNFVNSSDLPEVAVLVTKLIRNTEKIEGEGPYRLLAKDEEKMVIVTAFPLLNKEKKVENIIFSIKDISEKVREMDMNPSDEEIYEELGENEDVVEWMNEVYPKVENLKDEVLSGWIEDSDKIKIASEQ